MSQAVNAKRPSPGDRRPGVGGRRLADAFDTVTEMPALLEARRRLVGLCERQAPSPADVAEAIESDAALAVAVMRAATAYAVASPIPLEAPVTSTRRPASGLTVSPVSRRRSRRKRETGVSSSGTLTTSPPSGTASRRRR